MRVFAVLLYSSCLWAVAEAGTARPVSLLIRDVTIIDPETRKVLPRHDVYIDSDRIVWISARKQDDYTPQKTLDGEGRFLVPGFMDMHAHVGLPREYALPYYSFELFIANGVTTLRDPIGDCADPAKDVCLPELRALGRQIEAGERVGPRLASLSSPKIWGPDRRSSELPPGSPSFYFPATEEEGRELARFMHARGVDGVKLTHMIHPDGFRGLAAEAQLLQLEISGHPPYAFPLVQAADMGVRVFDHFIYLGPDCSRSGEEWHAKMHSHLARTDGGVKPHPPIEDVTIEKFDVELCRGVLRALASRDVYVTTTLLAFMWLLTQDINAVDRWVSPGQYEAWQRELRDAGPATRGWQRRMSAHSLGLIKLASELNVKLMLGTDAHAAGMVPGVSVHEEMALLRQAGIAPMEILHLATTVPARYLRKEKLFGGVAVGKIADLVLLEKNPLTDIGHTRSISSVVFGGKVFNRSELDALLSNVEKKVLQGRASK